MSSENDVALITGASAGIGRALAEVFAQNDFDLVVAARREDKLEELAAELREEYEVGVTVIASDLSKRKAAGALFDTVQEAGIEIDVLVNNAGVAIMQPLHESDPDELMRLVQLNVASLTALCGLFVAPMVERGYGRVLNVASIVSFFPTPSFAAYGASKAYVLSLTEAISQELKGTGVTATALCPGYTSTEMIGGALEGKGNGGLEGLVPEFAKMTPQAVALEGFKACMKGKPVHLDRLSGEFTAQWLKLQPRWLVRNVGGMLARLVKN